MMGASRLLPYRELLDLPSAGCLGGGRELIAPITAGRQLGDRRSLGADTCAWNSDSCLDFEVTRDLLTNIKSAAPTMFNEKCNHYGGWRWAGRGRKGRKTFLPTL